MLNVTFSWGWPCAMLLNAVLFTYRHVPWGKGVLFTSKLLPAHLSFSFPCQQKSLRKLSAGLLLFGPSYSQLWTHRKKPVGLPRCSGAESRSSTCPMKSVSSIGISKTWNWPSASSTSASSYCRTIRYLQKEVVFQSPLCKCLCACALCVLELPHSSHFFYVSFFFFPSILASLNIFKERADAWQLAADALVLFVELEMLSWPAEGPYFFLFRAGWAKQPWPSHGQNMKSHRDLLLLYCVVLCRAGAGKLGKKLFYLLFFMKPEILTYCFLLALP